MRRARGRRNTLARDLDILGIPLPGLKARDHEHAVELLDAWKSGALKQAYRRRVKETHPDLNPDDPDAAEKFQAVRMAFERASSIAVRPPAPVRSELGHGGSIKSYSAEEANALREEARRCVRVSRARPAPFSGASFGTTGSDAWNSNPWRDIRIVWA